MSDREVPHPGPGPLEQCELQVLAEELGDSRLALRFFSTYLAMLPGRLLRIADGLCRHDPDASMDAVLSLKISSAMVGAVETETQCRAIEMMIREDHFDSAVAALPELRKSSDRCFAAVPPLTGNTESFCRNPWNPQTG